MPLTQLPELGLVHIARSASREGNLPRIVPGRVCGSHTDIGEARGPCATEPSGRTSRCSKLRSSRPLSSSALAAIPHGNASAAPDKLRGSEGETGRHRTVGRLEVAASILTLAPDLLPPRRTKTES